MGYDFQFCVYAAFKLGMKNGDYVIFQPETITGKFLWEILHDWGRARVNIGTHTPVPCLCHYLLIIKNGLVKVL